MLELPRLSYPITRQFRWRRFEPVVYGIVLLVLGILIPVNLALTGYETIAINHSDFNAIPRHWYNRFVPAPKPGSQCEPHIYNIGDSLLTNYSIFTWTIQSLGTGSGSGSGSSLAYSGASLDKCDVSAINLVADSSHAVTIRAEVTCANPFLVLTTSFLSSLNRIEDTDAYKAPSWAPASGLQQNISFLLDDARTDVAIAIYDVPIADLVALYGTAPLLPSSGSAADNGTYCPRGYASHENTTCTQVPPILDVHGSLKIWSQLTDGSVPPVNQNYTIPIHNMMQVMLAAVRIDIGNTRPQNNFIVNPSVLNSTVRVPASLPNNSKLKTNYIFQPFSVPSIFPPNVDTSRPAVFNVLYQCRTTRIKDGGSVFISVLVATLSIFSSIWAGFMLVAAMAAKWDSPHANVCDPEHIKDEEGVGAGYDLVTPEFKYA